ncbi:tyrosine-protein phosphatase [Sphingobium sp. EM0848]|uniref:tyrosine-protein phosphatase n=1 Tax=Sphingobium sp. EM0848 TaxID=2743473 RepID=UPI00159C91E6|nr:tyrosine-protein phosphatase [Sphingobium sp. EM0848]
MRNILKMVLATIVASTGIPANARLTVPPAADSKVERIADGGYRVSWPEWADESVNLFVADRPDAPAAARRKLVDDDRDGMAEVTLNDAGRPYFYVQPAKGEGRWVAERVLPLEGGRNFRDIGGYRTADGRTVRWGRVYRSGSMARLTAHDFDYLGRLGIRSVYDFRTGRERRDEPNQWVAVAHIGYWTRNYAMSGGDLARLFNRKVTEAEARGLMVAAYRTLPYEQAPAYRKMFRQLIAGRLPLAFNCSAGKDRAGLAAALVLTAVGVPRETVFADYALTNRYLPAALARDNASDPILTTLSKSVTDVLLAADQAYIAAAFDEMAKRNGSPEGYLRDVVGLSTADQAQLKKLLLE